MNINKYLALALLLSASAQILPQEATEPAAEATVAEEAPAKAEPTKKIAIVDMQEVVMKSGYNKSFEQEAQATQNKLEKELKELGAKIKKEEDELAAKSSTLSEDALKEKQAKLEELKQDAQSRVQRAQKKLQETQMQIQGRMVNELREYAQKLLKKDGTIGVIFSNELVIAHDDSLDVTKELTALVKEEVTKKEATKKKAAAKPAVKPAAKPAAKTPVATEE